MGNGLHELGRRATKHDRPLTLLVYPEGTLVSKLTRPKSAAYAAKINQVRFWAQQLLFGRRVADSMLLDSRTCEINSCPVPPAYSSPFEHFYGQFPILPSTT